MNFSRIPEITNPFENNKVLLLFLIAWLQKNPDMLRIIQNHRNALVIFGNNPRICTDSAEHHPTPSHFPFLSVTPAPPPLTRSLPFCHPRPIPSFQDCSLRTKHDGRPSCSAYRDIMQLQTFIVDRQPPSDDSRSAVMELNGRAKSQWSADFCFP